MVTGAIRWLERVNVSGAAAAPFATNSPPHADTNARKKIAQTLPKYTTVERRIRQIEPCRKLSQGQCRLVNIAKARPRSMLPRLFSAPDHDDHTPDRSGFRAARARWQPPRSGTAFMIRIRRIRTDRSEEHTSELQSLRHLVCRL